METVDATPQAASLIESLRDVGYSMETALADILDNSIAAKASEIDILVVPPTEGSGSIAIIDDGTGMSRPELYNAMRPGSQNPLATREPSDLGRFGLGLKTASFSQCRRLTVVTRCEGEINAAIWDLDYVASHNEWVVQVPDDPGSVPFADRIAESGTLVLWEKLDRTSDSKDALSDFNQSLAQSANHLELTFHRFLSPQQPGKKPVVVSLNGRRLSAVDPFNERNHATTPSPVEWIPMGNDSIRVQAFTLPHHSKVSKTEWEKFALPGGYLKNQGFYVYRENRLIIYGTWFRLKNQSESTKLTRVRVDVPSMLDSQWKLDIKKESAQPPPEVRGRLRLIVDRFREQSIRVITRRASITLPDETVSLWQRVSLGDEVHYGICTDHPVLEGFAETLDSTQLAEFRKILGLIQTALPKDALYSDMAGDPDSVRTGEIADSDLENLLRIALDRLSEQGLNPDSAIDLIMNAEPYRSNRKRTLELFETISKGQQ